MSDDTRPEPLATETFTCDDVEVQECVRKHDGYFKIDRYILKHKKHEGGWTGPLMREIFERGHATAVLLYDPDLERLVFIEQFRPGAYAAFNSPWFDKDRHSPWLLECIAGIIDAGETPEAVARRESVEEANCEISDIEPIAHYLVSPGGTTESVFLFCGRIDASTAGGVYGLQHEGEDIRVLSVPTATALEWLNEGRFTNSMTLIAMQWFHINRDILKQKWGVKSGG
ncbi:MAG: NUDIX domain-containing protein [Rhodospirillales bacterium]|nr:NUDIX domain-containing protein [Rhodospirillales bacterium]